MGAREEPVKAWIDSHVHVSNRLPCGAIKEACIESLIQVLERSGRDLRFVISVDPMEMPAVLTDPGALVEGNRFIRKTANLAIGRLYGSCMVNPRHLSPSLFTMEECFERFGFVMLGEMLQYMMDYKMNSGPVRRIVRQAVQYDVPVQVHISTSNAGNHPSTFGTSQLYDMLGLAEQVPEAKYILGHLVGLSDPPVVEEYYEIIRRFSPAWPDNFWVEIRDFNSSGMEMTLERVPPRAHTCGHGLLHQRHASLQRLRDSFPLSWKHGGDVC